MSKRLSFYIVAALALIGLGYGAFSLGRILQGPPELRGTRFQTPVDVSTVSLTGADGKKVALADFRGTYTLVFFGYTHCPDVCPLTLARLAAAYRELGEPDALQVVMVSVDPVTDTPELTQHYAGSFHPKFVGLSGTNSEVAEAAKAFYIGFQAAEQEVAHTDAVILVTPKGQLEAVYSQANLRYLQEDLQTLLERL